MQRSLSLVSLVACLQSCNFIQRYRNELTQLVVASTVQAVRNHLQGNGGAPPQGPAVVEQVSAQLLTMRAMKTKGEERRQLLEQAAQAAPGAAMPHLLLGIEYQRQRQWGPAIQSYVNAAGIDQHNPVVQLNLAAAYAAHGERRQAREHMDEAFQLVASNPDAPPVVRHAVRAASALHRVQQVRHDRAHAVEQACRAAAEMVREFAPPEAASADAPPAVRDLLDGLAMAADSLLARSIPRDERAARLVQAAARAAGVPLAEGAESELGHGAVILAMDLMRLALPGLAQVPDPVRETLGAWEAGLAEGEAVALADELAAAVTPEPLHPDVDLAHPVDGYWQLRDGDGAGAEFELVCLDGDVIVRTRDASQLQLTRLEDRRLDLDWVGPVEPGLELRWVGRCEFAPDWNSATLSGERLVRGPEFVSTGPTRAVLVRVSNPVTAPPAPVHALPTDDLRPVPLSDGHGLRMVAYEAR